MRTALAVLLSFIVLATVAIATSTCSRPAQTDFSELSAAVQSLHGDFIDQGKLTNAALNQAAIQGIITYLNDPFTAYIPPDQYKAWTASLSGQNTEFDGIGAEMTVSNGDVLILEPLSGSPASNAGIKAGDVLLEVNGQSVQGMDINQVVSLIRGPKGTKVTLLVSRTGQPKPIQMTIVRAPITVTSVSEYMQGNGIGVIHLSDFDADTVKNLRNAIQLLKADGAQGLILDLRYNSGGLVDAAVGTASQFVQSGAVYILQKADGSKTPVPVIGNGIAYDMPLVVITNGYTASAAEIVTGALKDHHRATIVGTQTFGKGSVNVLVPLSSGAGLDITTAHWLTPDGNLIQGKGISPHIEVGTNVSVSRTQQISAQVQSLCSTFDQDPKALGDQTQLIGALDQLCNLKPQATNTSVGDQQMAVAVQTLRSMMSKGS